MVKKLFKCLILVVLILVLAFAIVKRTFPLKYSDYIDKYCNEYGIDRSLVYALVKAESNFDKDAHSTSDAYGLMQLKEETALWCAEKMGIEISTDEIKEPETNIKIGIWYFKYLIDNTSSTDIAVISYNAGLNKVKGWIDDGVITETDLNYDKIPYEETKNYIKKINFYREIYKILYNM